VFIDIESVTLGMNPEALEHILRRGPRLKALLPVHVFGNMANMPAIMSLADAFEVPVIEDAACALGAVLAGRPAGSWGHLGCFSFHPRKAATTGEGGAIRSADPALTRTLRTLRNHGQDPDASPAEFVAAGFNARLTEFQAALGTSQLARYDDLLAARRHRARRYDELLDPLPVQKPASLSVEAHVYQSYVVRLQGAAAARRDAIIAALRTQNIETNLGTYHMPMLSYFRSHCGHRVGDFPVTDRVAAAALALPLHAGLTAGEQETVVAALADELAR
jgi:dTDP-4-amino-4,6-dideoxygalactose transaminase